MAPNVYIKCRLLKRRYIIQEDVNKGFRFTTIFIWGRVNLTPGPGGGGVETYLGT